ncbi:MAG: ATP-binding protein [Candidatus Micrarchaeia archaeon]
MFINRFDELMLLEKLYKGEKPNLLVLYGRRRVGKTALLNEFSKRHKALYLVARQETQADQLKKISEETARFFQDEVIANNPFQNYDALFTYLAKKDLPVFFDEFPYLVESNKALPSILQEHWDKHFSKKKSLIVLCGSSIRMMESLLGYKSPIYGRRTAQVLLKPLNFKDSCKFLEGLSPEEKVSAFAVLGGMPAYLMEYNYKKPLLLNIKEKILAKNTFLYQDVLFVLKEELNEPSTYYSILKAIAKGNTKIGTIMNDTGLEKGKITKYLSVLQNLEIVERRVPITEKKPAKSRKGIYLLKDNYFKFWFWFVFENNEYIEQNKEDLLITEKIKPQLNNLTGKAFEEICLEWIKKQKKFNNYLFGRWWNNQNEIDIVGVNAKNNRILLGEVKWKKLSKKQAKKTILQLKEKSKQVKWGDNPKKTFMLIGKKVQSKNEVSKEAMVFELNDIFQKNTS